MIMILGLFALVVIDVAVKAYIEKHLEEGESIPTGKNKLLLRKKHNSGMALEYMADNPSMVSLLSGIATVIAGIVWLFLLPSRGKHVQKLGTTLLFAGGISNSLDHIRRGYVVDYLSVNSKNKGLKDLVFNLADIFVALGVLLLAFHDLFRKASK